MAVFSDWKPFIHDAGLSPIQMREIYLSSRFVVVGRGQSNLDCYRIYEAIICGAVPVSTLLLNVPSRDRVSFSMIQGQERLKDCISLESRIVRILSLSAS